MLGTCVLTSSVLATACDVRRPRVDDTVRVNVYAMPSGVAASVLLGMLTTAADGRERALPSRLTHSFPSAVTHSQVYSSTAVELSGSPLADASRTKSDD